MDYDETINWEHVATFHKAKGARKYMRANNNFNYRMDTEYTNGDIDSIELNRGDY
jgi:hypothetical protein